MRTCTSIHACKVRTPLQRKCSRHRLTPQHVLVQPFGVTLPSRMRQTHAHCVVVVRATEDEDYEPELDAMERMDKSIESLERELIGIRTGRANPAMLSTIQVDYYGAPTPLQSLASVSSPDSQTLMISPFDKGSMKEIETAITNSGLGFTPNNDGKVIRINVPPLTEERRKEMAKLASGAGEDGKVAIRNVRRDVMKKIGNLDLSEDDIKALENEIQKLTDSYVKQVDEAVAKKNKELTTV
eukprot:TRINITY_DN4746_c0_g1_i1.p1 TRINITY_DN4746_c0_g1~~TRINITY_DN4746_c0_g1_i1.p1  ORF type:complete len:241 (-),score=25.25 TRINITY_DN4746_c0_g1_i1:268-990(-)